MSPILVRPVREQLEHDRVIRLLQVKLKRKHDVVANIGEEQTVPVRIGQVQVYPDLVLTSVDRGKKLMGTVEVETAESVNHLEAMAQWAHLGRAKAPFHLYVPAGCVDIARRLAAENAVNVAEIWSYHTIADQTRFTLVHRAAVQEPKRSIPKPEDGASTPVRKGSVKAAAKTGGARPTASKATPAGRPAPRTGAAPGAGAAKSGAAKRPPAKSSAKTASRKDSAKRK